MTPKPLPPFHPNNNITKKSLHHARGPLIGGHRLLARLWVRWEGSSPDRLRFLPAASPASGQAQANKSLGTPAAPTAASSATGMALCSWSQQAGSADAGGACSGCAVRRGRWCSGRGWCGVLSSAAGRGGTWRGLRQAGDGGRRRREM